MRPSAVLVAAALAIGCAHGVTEEDGFVPLSTAAAGGAGGAGGSQDATTASSSATGGGDEGGMGGAPPACTYDAPNTCPTAQQLGAIAGDENDPPVVVGGSTSIWFVIHVQEQVSSISDADMSYSVTLESPPGMDFDLFVHQGPQDGDPDCNAAPLQDVPTNPIEIVQSGWDDDQGIGGEDDSLWLCIEVRYVSGTACGPDAEWTLTIEGNT